MELAKSQTKIINTNRVGKMPLFLFLFFFTMWIEARAQREGAEGRNRNNFKHKCYVALCLSMLLLFCVLKGSQD